MIRNTLYTIGYEGSDINSFLSSLKDFGVTAVIDVRELPLSRKKGFSKNKLANRLSAERIDYRHFKALGSPRQLRFKLRKDKDYNYFFAAMDKYLNSQVDALRKVYEFMQNKTCCLLCYEKELEKCHRKMVAEQLKKIDGNGLEIENILVT